MLVQPESLPLASVTTRILYFHISTDYILIFFSKDLHHFHHQPLMVYN
nr:MAG TPA: hypothetical protein [Caudoviricetes sp.]